MIPEIKSAIINSLIRSSEERLSWFDCKVKGLCACCCLSVNLLILYMGEIVMLNIFLHNVIGCSMWEKNIYHAHRGRHPLHPCTTTTMYHNYCLAHVHWTHGHTAICFSHQMTSRMSKMPFCCPCRVQNWYNQTV